MLCWNMRKVILGAGISLDGYVAKPDGGIDFLYQPKGYSMAAFFTTLDAVVFGRKTFDEAVKRGGGSYKSPMKMPTYVFSKSQPPGERDGVIFANQPPAAVVRQLRKRPGKHIFVMGGGELARSFLQDDVVDELYLGIYPVLLGAGIPFFPAGFPQRDFKLVASKTYGPGGFLEVTYARSR
jgi:dihydrofolate reductase